MGKDIEGNATRQIAVASRMATGRNGEHSVLRIGKLFGEISVGNVVHTFEKPYNA